MQNKVYLENTNWIKGINNYSKFITSFTHFITNYFESYTFKSCSEKHLLIGEEHIVQSLLLNEKLHMYLFLSFSTFEKYIHLPENAHPFTSDLSFHLLQKLQNSIDQHDFLKEENRTLCQKVIAQILNYYPQSSNHNIKFILSPLSEPLMPNNEVTISY